MKKGMARNLALRCMAVLMCVCLCAPQIACAQGLDEGLETLIARMSPLERVGQIFIVGFPDDSAAENAEMLELIEKYRIGGVVLTAQNQGAGSSQERVVALREMIADLQKAALSPLSPAPTAPSVQVTTTPGASPSPTPPGQSPTAPGPSPAASAGATQTPQAEAKVPVPLLVVIAPETLSSLSSGTDLEIALSTIALGATWNTEYAAKAGTLVGQSLRTLGVNMFLGPVVDLATPSRAGLPGDLGARIFGESAFWVRRMAEAYADGMRAGSVGSVLAIAAHFPGWGSTDRAVAEEVPVVQSSLEAHLQTDLAPFVGLSAPRADGTIGTVDGILVSHVQFRGVTSATQMTRPVSFDPLALQYFLSLPEVSPWRADGGLAVSDSLGSLSVRRLYDSQMTDFQAKRVAYDAFLAGNDILTLDAMGTYRDDWEGHFSAVRETLEFFYSKYQSDTAFRSRLDESLRRILSAKRRIYSRFSAESVIAPALEPDHWGRSAGDLSQIARAAVTLIYPRADELIAKVPEPPSVAESIVVFEDVRSVSPCAECESVSVPEPDTVVGALRSLYGQEGSGHVDAAKVQGYSFADLWEYLQSETILSETSASLEKAVAEANWLVFAAQDMDPGAPAESAALRVILEQRGSLLVGKRVVVIACGAPYYLDSTNIARVSAFYAVYSATRPAIEAGLRALFKEFAPAGLSPVSVPGAQYSVAERLQPSTDQMLYAELPGDRPIDPSGVASIGLGDTLALTTGLIRDWNGNMVPDGTAVTFSLSYPAVRIAWQQTALTKNGRAQTTLRLDTPGTLEVSVMSGAAQRTAKMLVTIEGDMPAVISTIVPTPAPAETPNVTPLPVFPGEPVSPPIAESRPLDMSAFLLALAGLGAMCLVVLALGARRHYGWVSAEIALLSFSGGMVGYLLWGAVITLWARAPWLVTVREALPWRWQLAVAAWALGGIVAAIGCSRPAIASRVAGSIRRATGGSG